MSQGPSSDRRIQDEAIARLLTPSDFVASCDEAFRLYGSGEMVNPPREERVTRKDGAELFRLVLSGEWRGRCRGRKVIEERSEVQTGRLGEREAYIELTDLTTGHRTVFDADVITDMRTGAAAALGARYLGPDRVVSAAILGTGRIAKAIALCLDAAVGPREIRATSRRAENREAFEESVGPRVEAPLVMCDSIERCMEGAHVVLTAVPTPTPIVHSGDIGEETLVCAVAGDPRTNQLAMDLMCSRPIVVDEPDQARRSGDFVAAESRDLAEAVGVVVGDSGRAMTIGDAALGRLAHLKGRGAVCYLTGLAVQDIHAAATVLARLPDRA